MGLAVLNKHTDHSKNLMTDLTITCLLLRLSMPRFANHSRVNHSSTPHAWGAVEVAPGPQAYQAVKPNQDLRTNDLERTDVVGFLLFTIVVYSMR